MSENINRDWIDRHLKSVLADIYNKREHEITKDFLGTLTEINLSEKNISNLKGIQFANNVTTLILNKNNIKNTTYLKTLVKLTNIELSENKIEDASFLTNLKKLKTINLDSNNISKMPNLTYLKELKAINLSNNRISSLHFIENPTDRNINIIATEQCILLKPVLVYQGFDFTFSPTLMWDNQTEVCCDNIQVTGEYRSLSTDGRPGILYSISEIKIEDMQSDCIIKADFYHEVLFSTSGIFSGVVIQPIMVKVSKELCNVEKLRKYKDTAIIYGNLEIEDVFIIDFIDNESENIISGRTVMIINSNGEKIYSRTNSRGEFEFDNLSCGRYTLLFPFISGYKYITQSLHIINLQDDECVEINAILSSE